MPHATRPDRNLPLHPGINFSRMPVGGDLGGLVFVVGGTTAVLIGLPFLGPFFVVAGIGGVGVAAALFAWHRRFESGRDDPKIKA